jgi:hypothetical protein
MCELARALTMLDTDELQKCYSILQKRQSLEEHVKGGELKGSQGGRKNWIHHAMDENRKCY